MITKRLERWVSSRFSMLYTRSMPASPIPRFIANNLYYLEDVRKRLIGAVIIFIITFIAGFSYSGPIVRYLLSKIDLEQVAMVVTSPFQFLNLASDIGILVGLLFTLPYLFIQFFLFIRPALSKEEFLSLLLLIPATLFLFCLGTLYGFAALYYGLQLIADLNTSFGLQNLWDIGLFIAEIMITSLLLGACFEFPIIIYLAGKAGFLSRQALMRRRRMAYAAIIIFVALLPPTDGISLLIMTLPLVVLYEASLLLLA